MAYIDKNCARKLVEKHREMFEKMISGKIPFRDSLRKIINKVYIILLLFKLILIGSIWWLVSSIDQIYGVFYLLILSFVQVKKLLDIDFIDLENNIVEAVADIGISDASKINEVKSNDREDFEGSNEESSTKKDKEKPRSD